MLNVVDWIQAIFIDEAQRLGVEVGELLRLQLLLQAREAVSIYIEPGMGFTHALDMGNEPGMNVRRGWVKEVSAGPGKRLELMVDYNSAGTLWYHVELHTERDRIKRVILEEAERCGVLITDDMRVTHLSWEIEGVLPKAAEKAQWRRATSGAEWRTKRSLWLGGRKYLTLTFAWDGAALWYDSKVEDGGWWY